MRLLKVACVIVIFLVALGGVAYESFSYGHRTGYNSAQVVANRQISSLNTQVKSEKAQVSKEDTQMWNLISENIAQSKTSAAPAALHCTSYSYGINNQSTSINCD